MDNKKESIIILWDFAECGDVSLQHAVLLAKEVESNLVFFHIVPGGGLFGSKSKIEEKKKSALEKITPISDKTQKEKNIKVDVEVRDGSFAKNFKDVADKYNANLVIMGKSFLSGSHTNNIKDVLKAAVENNVPVIQATAPPAHEKYSEIVVPLDHNKKYKEKLHWIIYLSKYYNFNVNIIKTFVNDDLLKRQLSNNIFFTKKMLDSKKIVYGIKTAKKTSEYSDEIFRFANDIEADLIVVMTPEYNSYIQKSNGLENQKVPIMCINPRPDLQKFAGFK
jgi:nucleotide-binding universal stress UspA family protein